MFVTNLPENSLFFAAAFAVVAVLMPLVRRIAIKIDFVDRPGGRKQHDDAVPPIGGLVIFPAFMILALVYGVDIQSYGQSYGPFFAALVLILVTGALDDKYGVPAWTKFAVQFIAAFMVVVPGGATLVMLGDLFGFGDFGLNFMAVPFSIIATVLLVNAINLIDGLDGLSGGKGFVALFWLAVGCVLGGALQPLGLILILMGALGGFLLYNMRSPLRRKASVFIGDSGSLALGLALAWFSIHLAKGFNPVVSPMTVAWILALPIMDTCGQFARRVREKRHPFDADHNHFHHHFIHAGVPVGRSTFIILLLGFMTGLIGVGGMWLGLPEAALTYPWIVLLFAHIYMSMKPERFQRLIEKLSGRSAS